MTMLLPAFLWLLTNSTLNMHSHLTPVGTVISHAHPFQKNQAEPAPIQGHHHTPGELWLLDLFSILLFSLVTAATIQLISKDLPLTPKERAVHKVPVKEYYQVYHYHAPPAGH
jgi:hypothetical protein